ncbi:MAG: hypothetical protein M3Z07_03650 [Candidatus Eremiobacteraeota bacterium]|nr:hypothetical protein [Candidatus Eremiobacteraeota bacterium]MDQ6823569.1 hypothetical protein [Candidatus Eremiobacteraeota bacterium]
MSIELLNAIAAIGTFVVIAASAVAALIQLRQMSAGNQLDAVLSLERDFRGPEIQDSLRYVQTELPERLRDDGYRRELIEIGFVDSRTHRELVACNWFNAMGTLLKNGLVSEHTFMDLFGRLIVYYWNQLTPVVALMRRNRGATQYHDFEYIAGRARVWIDRFPSGTFPAKMKRENLTDPFMEGDGRLPSP